MGGHRGLLPLTLPAQWILPGTPPRGGVRSLDEEIGCGVGQGCLPAYCPEVQFMGAVLGVCRGGNS